MSNGTLRIVVVGLGGQGVVFASKVMGEAILRTNRNVIMSEVHGMAQRGGVVTCHICIGDTYSPLIGDGEADIILSFEPIEAYKTLQKANSDTLIITNTAPIIPITASIGQVKYPDVEDVLSAIRKANKHLIILNATKLAIEAGTHFTTNSVMIGVLAGTNKLPIEPGLLRKYLLTRVPPKTVEPNSKAFDLGLQWQRQPTN